MREGGGHVHTQAGSDRLLEGVPAWSPACPVRCVFAAACLRLAGGPPDSATRHRHLLPTASGASTPSRRGLFVSGERGTLCLAREVRDLEKDPGSKRQVCWKCVI